jgi:hypothetical protein
MQVIRGSSQSESHSESESESVLDAEFAEQDKPKSSSMNPFSVDLCGSEFVNQCAVIQWCSVVSRFGIDIGNDPRSYTEEGYARFSGLSYRVTPNEILLKWIYAIPLNQSNAVAGLKMRSQGAKKGYPDLGLDVSRGIYKGLRIEMKKESERSKKLGGLKPEQIEWQNFLIEQGYKHCVCYNWIECRNVLVDYLSIGVNQRG